MEGVNLQDLQSNPELAAWLDSLRKNVASSQSERQHQQKSDEPRIYLPNIDMSKKFYQNNGKTYPEMQGVINVLPIPWKGNRVTEISGIYQCWCPSDDAWSSGFSYRILPPEFYPEGEVRNKINELRERIRKLENDKKVTWKEVKHQAVTLILSFVLMHRNTKGDLISSRLFGGDQMVEHKFVPALVICPNRKVQQAIQSDLDLKPNPVPYALQCYSDAPLIDRKGWMSIKFVDAAKGSFGYDVTVSTELVNPMINPDGLIPSSVNLEDERVKLLYTTDPIRNWLDWHQVNQETGEYFNEGSLKRLGDFIAWLENGKQSPK